MVLTAVIPTIAAVERVTRTLELSMDSSVGDSGSGGRRDGGGSGDKRDGGGSGSGVRGADGTQQCLVEQPRSPHALASKPRRQQEPSSPQ